MGPFSVSTLLIVFSFWFWCRRLNYTVNRQTYKMFLSYLLQNSTDFLTTSEPTRSRFWVKRTTGRFLAFSRLSVSFFIFYSFSSISIIVGHLYASLTSQSLLVYCRILFLSCIRIYASQRNFQSNVAVLVEQSVDEFQIARA